MGALVWQGVAISLFNPLTLQVSTRGSCESFTVVLLYGVFDMLCMRRNIPVAAILFGTAVHWRVYPIIYSLPLAMVAGRIDSNGSFRNIFHSGSITFLGTSGSLCSRAWHRCSWPRGLEGGFAPDPYVRHTEQGRHCAIFRLVVRTPTSSTTLVAGGRSTSVEFGSVVCR